MRRTIYHTLLRVNRISCMNVELTYVILHIAHDSFTLCEYRASSSMILYVFRSDMCCLVGSNYD